MFKVGDKVRVRKDVDTPFPGEEGTVYSIIGKSLNIKFASNPKLYGYYDFELESYEDSKMISKDKVRDVLLRDGHYKLAKELELMQLPSKLGSVVESTQGYIFFKTTLGWTNKYSSPYPDSEISYKRTIFEPEN